MTFKSFDEYNDFRCTNPNFTGTCIVLHSNGKKWFERNFVDGKQHGKQYCWYSDGQKWYEGKFANGIRFGIQIDGKETYEEKPEDGRIWYILVKETL